MIEMMEQTVPSVRQLMTQNQDEWLIHQRVILPSRGTLTGFLTSFSICAGIGTTLTH